MRVFKIKLFARFARRERIPDINLCEAISRAERGIVDADVGGDIIKQRVPRKGTGRSGGFRTLIAYNSGIRAVFLYGFAKSERGNIEDNELAELREIAAIWLNATDERIQQQIEKSLLQEINCNEAK